MRFLLYILASATLPGLVKAGSPPSMSHHALLRRGHNPQKDIYLGTLDSVDDLFLRLGTNSSEWEMIRGEEMELEAVQEAATVERRNSYNLQLNPSEECAERTGIDYFACEALPHRYYFWAAGVSVIIYWTPSIIDAWLNDVTRFYLNGALNVFFRYRRMRDLEEGPANRLKVRHVNVEGLDLGALDISLLNDNNSEPEVIHFNVEEKLPNMSKRDLSEDARSGILHEARAWERYALDTRTGILKSEGSDITMKVDASERSIRNTARDSSHESPEYGEEMRWGSGRPSVLQAAEKYESYTIIITAQRSGNYFPFSSASCVKKWLYNRLWDAEEVGRASCQPMAEEATRVTDYSVSGVFINPGGDDFNLKWGDCCGPPY